MSRSPQAPRPDTPEGIHVALASLPMHHTYGFHICCFRAFEKPVTLAILRRWDVDVALKLIARSGRRPHCCLISSQLSTMLSRLRITILTVVPSLLLQLVNSPMTKKADLTSLSAVTSGAAYLPPKLAQDFVKLCPKIMKLGNGQI
jgi:acyl-CoA synthetase (AMP-forming)/AMP-acid ligase II